MGEMHDMYGAWDNGEFNPLEGDSDPIEICVNCDEPFESSNPKLFCSDLCQSTANLSATFAGAGPTDGSSSLTYVKPSTSGSPSSLEEAMIRAAGHFHQRLGLPYSLAITAPGQLCGEDGLRFTTSMVPATRLRTCSCYVTNVICA